MGNSVDGKKQRPAAPEIYGMVRDGVHPTMVQGLAQVSTTSAG